jgi:hypothetical protein
MPTPQHLAVRRTAYLMSRGFGGDDCESVVGEVGDEVQGADGPAGPEEAEVAYTQSLNLPHPQWLF